MNLIINPELVKTLHDQCILRWKDKGADFTQKDFFRLVEENHAYNYQLWNAEDRARREDMGFEFVYNAKREIDQCNQQRNNRMEMMDEWLYTRLDPANPATCPVHSETPGMMIDRLSILALKEYHMEQQTRRDNVDDSHRQVCQQKLQTIQAQRKQLDHCLAQFLLEITNKTRTFKVYHQFKMYNDPTLNPQLYARS